MKKLKKISILFCFMFILASCEKEVEIKLPESKNKLVVEGWIEQDSVAVISLTRNTSYFSKVDSSTLANLFIKDAIITISDGINSEQLQPDISNLFNGIWPFYCYKGLTLKGEIGKTYYLTIIAEGDTITGQTTIPEPVKFDTIWWKPDSVGNKNNDSLGFLWAIYTDDPSVQQYTRVFTKRLGRDKQYIPVFGSVYSDELFTGKTFTFSMSRGIESMTDANAIENDKELFYFKKGDTLDVKVCALDRKHYEFWRTLEQESMTGGNPFTFPVVIRHNVTNANGVFGGYCSQYLRIIIGK